MKRSVQLGKFEFLERYRKLFSSQKEASTHFNVSVTTMRKMEMTDLISPFVLHVLEVMEADRERHRDDKLRRDAAALANIAAPAGDLERPDFIKRAVERERAGREETEAERKNREWNELPDTM